MNPSTADILDAVERVNAKTVFVLPNNKNIILAAQQARELVEGKKVDRYSVQRLCPRESQLSSIILTAVPQKRMKRL